MCVLRFSMVQICDRLNYKIAITPFLWYIWSEKALMESFSSSALDHFQDPTLSPNQHVQFLNYTCPGFLHRLPWLEDTTQEVKMGLVWATLWFSKVNYSRAYRCYDVNEAEVINWLPFTNFTQSRKGEPQLRNCPVSMPMGHFLHSLNLEGSVHFGEHYPLGRRSWLYKKWTWASQQAESLHVPPSAPAWVTALVSLKWVTMVYKPKPPFLPQVNNKLG